MAKRHYKGDLGEFVYDTKEFSLVDDELVYIGKEVDGDKIHIPEGIVYCEGMFANSNIVSAPKIPDSAWICRRMFEGCTELRTPPVIPEGVEYIDGMFSGCKNLKKAPIIPKSVLCCYLLSEGCSYDARREFRYNVSHRGKCQNQKALAR